MATPQEIEEGKAFVVGIGCGVVSTTLFFSAAIFMGWVLFG